ncbi:hypothetical protein [Burkholderia sp. GS2Y]|uniref:Zona occludens toxin N-terminal domain-containing protein n=1 Tax=Burkholderia theae TaxID=3143496 RepID=A0ABU9WG90_9BURK
MTAGIHNSADIIGVVGATSMGKGLYIKADLRRVPRSRGIVVWSPLEETDNYAEVIGGRAYTSIAEAVTAIKRGEKRIVFVPKEGDKAMKEQFDRFCRMVWHLEGWIAVIEELSGVTQASWAPPAWKKLSTAGRHRGLKIYGTSQRPALVDKSFFGNCTEIRCYRLGYEDDAKTMKSVMFIDHRELLKLQQFQFIHHHKATGMNQAGVVYPPKK